MALRKTSDTTLLHHEERPADKHDSREQARDIGGLLAQLSHADATTRRWAARDLAAHPEAATALCARLVCEPDAGVRSALFTSVAHLGAGDKGSDVVKALLPLLRSEDPGLRNGAIEVLSGLPDAVAPHIEALLRDADSDVRIFTVNLLGDLRHPQVPRWLQQVLLQDAAVNVVGAALEVLTEVGTRESLPALRAVAQRFEGEAFIGFAVSLAAERIGTP